MLLTELAALDGVQGGEGEEGRGKADHHPDDPNSYQSPEVLETGLSTMTKLPSYRWMSLLHLDIIKAS